MKVNKTLTALIASAGLGLSGHAFALGTASNTLIENTATLNYQVNGNDVPSATTKAEFRVDTKIDISLSTTATESADAGDSITLSYTLQNDGNADQEFKLDTDNGSTTFYRTSDDTEIVNGLITLTPDTPFGFYKSDTIADDAADGSTVTFHVRARAWDASANAGAGDYLAESTADKNADDTSLVSVYVVFAEDTTDQTLPLSGGTDRDGGFVVKKDMNISAPELTSTKSVAVKDDGLGNATSYAIPGATMTYTITIESTGSKTATGVSFQDSMPSGLDTASISNIVVTDITVPASPVVLTAGTHYTVVNDGTDGNAMDITLPDMPQNDELTITFDIEIDDGV